MTTETEEKEESEVFLRGFKPSKKWRTRTSRMNTIHEPVPKAVWMGFLISALLFTMLHFFNQWWWHIDEIP
jgi:membrane protease YdiL (CAAX protease family)